MMEKVFEGCAYLAVAIVFLAALFRRPGGGGGSAAGQDPPHDHWPAFPPCGGLLIVLALLAPSVARADETPAPSPFQVEAQSLALTLVKPGEDRIPLIGARVRAWYTLSTRLTIDGRADATATSDGSATEVSITDPASFSTLELYGSVRYRVFERGPVRLHVAALYGYVIPTQDGHIAVLDRYPLVLGGGIVYTDDSRRWMFVGLGRNDSAGSGLRVLFSGEIPIDIHVSIIADGAIDPAEPTRGGASFVRTGVAVKVIK